MRLNDNNTFIGINPPLRKLTFGSLTMYSLKSLAISSTLLRSTPRW